MAHFAKIDENGTVLNVIVAEQDFIDSGAVGNPSTWIQTSYNTYEGAHLLGGAPLRKNYATIGGKYDSIRDAFIPPKPFESWVFNEETCAFKPPVPRPDNTKEWIWKEETQSWSLPDKPFDNWVYDERGIPQPPVPIPSNTEPWVWNQETTSWDLAPPPFPGWVFNTDTKLFEAPIPRPNSINNWAPRWSVIKNDWIPAGPPYNSWSLNENDEWAAPIPKPNDETPENPYTWNEADKIWVPFMPKEEQ